MWSNGVDKPQPVEVGKIENLILEARFADFPEKAHRPISSPRKPLVVRHHKRRGSDRPLEGLYLSNGCRVVLRSVRLGWLLSGLGPGSRSELLDLLIGSSGQPFEYVGQVLERVDFMPAATAQQRINNGAVPASVGMTGEEKVLFANGGRTNGVLDQVVVNLHAAVLDVAG